MKVHFFLLSILIFSSFRAFSQVVTVDITWSEPLYFVKDGVNYFLPVINGEPTNQILPRFNVVREIKNSNYDVKIKNVKLAKSTEKDDFYLNQFNISGPNLFQPEVKCTRAGSASYLSIVGMPYVFENNQWFRVLQFDCELTPKPKPSIEKDFALQSVLSAGSGSWYKIAVKTDGIYKIDKSLLNDLGISTNNLNPNHIHIYGNGGGAIPELNSAPYTDDLTQNSIQLIGAADGVFNDNDYILFYAFGPHNWVANGNVEFDQKRNPYSDRAYYFININSTTPPMLIQEVDASFGLEQTSFNSYDYRDVYENDLVSLVGGGKRWYGELFDIELERTVNFSIPGLDLNTPIKFRSAIASNSLSSAGTAQKFYNNGNLLTQAALPYTYTDFSRSVLNFTDPSPINSNVSLLISVTRNSANTLTYLDRILMNCRRNLSFTGSQFGFRNLTLADTSLLAKYTITSFPSSAFVWDLSNPRSPQKIKGLLNGTNFSFWRNQAYTEYVAASGVSFFAPEAIGAVQNQNLHALPQADYLIVSHPNFLSQAERLAELHRGEGLDVNVVNVFQVYNEFSSGAPDAAAIRKLAKMFHDRADQNGTKPLKYLCLFGDGTYDPKDRINNNNNFIMTYQVDNSENHISALVTDDFFGMLDDNEAIFDTDLLDIGVGRLLISDLSQAKQQVDKIEHYMKNGSGLFTNGINNCCLDDTTNSTFGDWRTKVTQIADDEENGYFIKNDSEPQYYNMKTNHREINCDKLYLDAYPQQTSAGGQRYPDVFDAITDRIRRGTLVMNYVGHGGEVGLAEERVVTIPQIQSWQNINALTLFVSATCEFTKFDDPSRISAGEWVALNPKGGAIALMTTTRSVFFGVNTNVGNSFFNNVFQRDANNLPRTFGEIAMLTKNQSFSSDNKRSFTLIGDPALRLALPRLNVVTDSINGQSVSVMDTLKALSKVTVKGHVQNFNGQIESNFNGTVIPAMYDKIKVFQTMGQDGGSPVINFELQRNLIYKGKATVLNGQFEFSFIVPKDILLNYGLGKMSYYAYSNTTDALGVDTTFIIGGIDPNGINDSIGPDLSLYMNDENFVEGGTTDESPILFVKAFDESGINTVGSGIGHDIVAILDGKTSEPIVLNDYYSADLNTYQSGRIKYPIQSLSSGNHEVKVKVWDVNNNSAESTIRFTVQEQQEAAISRVYNYPNPFTTQTEFMLDHNQSCDLLNVQIEIYTITGKLVKTLNQTIATKGFTVRGLNWDGLDEYGDQLAKGVYVYRAIIQNPEGSKAEKTEKLVLLK